jgi:hypothetical protein
MPTLAKVSPYVRLNIINWGLSRPSRYCSQTSTSGKSSRVSQSSANTAATGKMKSSFDTTSCATVTVTPGHLD